MNRQEKKCKESKKNEQTRKNLVPISNLSHSFESYSPSKSSDLSLNDFNNYLQRYKHKINNNEYLLANKTKIRAITNFLKPIEQKLDELEQEKMNI